MINVFSHRVLSGRPGSMRPSQEGLNASITCLWIVACELAGISVSEDPMGMNSSGKL